MPQVKNENRVYNARPDTLDFRDRMYEATLIEVPSRVPLEDYLEYEVPILDQGKEGACTGFGLATVANYLLRRRKFERDDTPVSPRMFYTMARRYDEWAGEDYDGSSARGAMKGWHKHGVCAEDIWPYKATDSKEFLDDPRAQDARQRPLGAYSRVNHKDLVCMHSALSEVGVLYATGNVHEGWQKVDAEGLIPRIGGVLGGHAFAIVAFERRGFWIQNSWGTGWGKGGFALLSYDDWLEHGSDVWVARLGAPVEFETLDAATGSMAAGAGRRISYAQADVRSHIISIGNNGLLRESGTYGNSEQEVAALFNDIPDRIAGWKKKRILLYAHGGLTDEESAVQRVAEYRSALLDHEIYPLAFIWKTDFWTTLVNILQDALSRRRPEGFLDSAKDFMLDRLDDMLEPLARTLGGKAEWDEMKENGQLATEDARGGASIALRYLAELCKKEPKLEIHVAGHSAGAIFLAPLIELLTAQGKIADGALKGRDGYNQKIKTCTLWAPACTTELFKRSYLPAIKARRVGRFALFTLTGKAEQDDYCDFYGQPIYYKSLLYLVSNAFEARPRIPCFRDGVPLLGMEKFIAEDDDFRKLFATQNADWVLSPNDAAANSPIHSTSRRHGDFDDDKDTLQATLTRILDQGSVQQGFDLHRSESGMRSQRTRLDYSTFASPRRA